MFVAPSRAFEALKTLRPFALLESASPHLRTGRHSFLGLNGTVLWQCRRAANPKDAQSLQHVVNQWRRSPGPGLLFLVFAYEWKNALESLPQRAKDDMHFPAATLLACDQYLQWDHARGRMRVIAPQAAMIRRIKGMLARVPKGYAGEERQPTAQEPGLFPKGWKSGMPRRAFEDKVRRIQAFIAAGDIYQANLSLRFRRKFHGDGFALYQALRRINPSPFAGYLRFGAWELISCSPERLVSLKGNVLTTRPIAGTRPRGKSLLDDTHRRKELLLSPKERAEHIMLVDLERNDMGKVCARGSVRLRETMAVERYSHVQHIVSDIRARLRQGVGFADIMRAVFPGGTITGVPKIRCMQILDALEPHARGPYTGSFGVMHKNGDFDLNIAIRTLWRHGDTLSLQAGAGIVADSLPDQEYLETLQKAKAMALAAEIASDKMRPFTTIRERSWKP